MSNSSVSCGCYAKEEREKRDKFDYGTGKGWKVAEDLVGKKFGKLTVIERVENYRSPGIGRQTAMYRCKCDCGGEVTVSGSRLRRGRAKSCSCYKSQRTHEIHFKDLTGQKFGRLTVIERVEDHIYPSGGKRTMYRSLCSCGNETISSAASLVNGTKLSCGCLISKGEEVISKLLNDNGIKFTKQKSFKDLLSDRGCMLRFDFWIEDKYLLEFDGSHHFECTNRIWNTKEHFAKTQKHDMRKNEYCKVNNIPLIRIPYTHTSKICLEDLLLESSKFVI